MSVFEIAMLICFGASWPLSIYKTWRVKTSQGKSLRFLLLIAVGYASGCLHKILNDPDPVLYLYAINGLMVLADLFLSLHYRLEERRA